MTLRVIRTPDGRALLNVGCGATYSTEWTNLDLVARPPDVARFDLRRALPFPDRTFDAAYSSHLLEHLSPGDGAALLRELHRCVVPGGVCRIVVPDFEQACREYLATLERAALGDDEAGDRRYRWALVQVVDQFVRDRSGGRVKEMILEDDIDEPYVRERNGDELVDTVRAAAAREAAGGTSGVIPSLLRRIARPFLPPGSFAASGELHRWAYDRRSLSTLLRSTGLQDVRAVSFDESAIPGWRRWALDARPDGRAPRKPGSLFMEGTRA